MSELRNNQEPMLTARWLVEEHIRIWGMVPHPDKMKEAIAREMASLKENDKSLLHATGQILDRDARIAKLQNLLYRVVNHGNATGDKELIADIQRATPEAGWTDVIDNAGGAPGPEPRSPTSELLEPPSSRRGEPAPDLPDVFTQAAATLGPLTAIAKEVMLHSVSEPQHDTRPRSAQSPAGAVTDEMVERANQAYEERWRDTNNPGNRRRAMKAALTAALDSAAPR